MVMGTESNVGYKQGASAPQKKSKNQSRYTGTNSMVHSGRRHEGVKKGSQLNNRTNIGSDTT